MSRPRNLSHYLTINLDDETDAAVKAAAAAEDRKKSEWARLILRDELRKRGLLPEKTS